MPNTRPDSVFVDGVCPACITHEARKNIDWAERKDNLVKLLESNKRMSGYDCIVPSSGGKDSIAQVLTLLELGANPIVVTASTCHLTDVGRQNIDNLKRFADTIEVSPR
jgi:tRNA(Ile)-lysidine synthase TilS/MesJ